ncbi:sensors of blue-light using FAD [Roseovarius sp. A-2]|uniref:BLUF domain-containing protein n=1 Tax=Roseovarius sp. A-2 TaxID=1570360 RepID=UPI0009B54256|nr:BLUF domain-containing protein [Roseovarius sp. A-2]GAW33642.1 sensors of blue-light using FAD [Roseovarius sp. A-2]
MKYIVYVSQAKAPLSKDALKELLEKSRARNADDAITGLLLYRYSKDFDKGYFIQAIEGPDGVLDALWERISQDNRHHTIVTLAEGTELERMFPNWSMGFKNVEAIDLADVPGFAKIETESFWQNLKANQMPESVDLLRGFYDGD